MIKEYYTHLYDLWQSKNFNIDYEFYVKNEGDFKAGTLLDIAIHGNFRKGQTLSNLAQALIKSGADINKRTEGGFTYLHKSVIVGLPNVLRALVEQGADDKKERLLYIVQLSCILMVHQLSAKNVLKF